MADIRSGAEKVAGAAVQHVWLRFGITDKEIRCLFGPGLVKTKGGGGYWEEVVRPYLPPLVVWRGPKEAYQHTIPCILDGWHDNNEDVELARRQIEELSGVLVGTLDKAGVPQCVEPPIIFIDAEGTLAHDVTESPAFGWVIKEPPEYGETVRNSRTGRLIRLEFTITFVLHEDDISVHRQGITAVKGTYIQFPFGYTFEKIASLSVKKHGLGDGHLGTHLAQFNGRKPGNGREKPRKGEPVHLPNAQELQRWKKEGRGSSRFKKKR